MQLKEAEKKCICPKCPTYAKCKESVAFCFSGESKCIKEGKGCICPKCPVHSEMKFKKWYYCLEGKE